MSELSDGNMARIEVDETSAAAIADLPPRRKRRLHLIIEGPLLELLPAGLPPEYQVTPLAQLDAAALTDAAAAGDWLVWIGPGEQLPPALSLGCFRPSRNPLAVHPAAGSPLVGEFPWNQARLSGAYLAPPKEMPAHNFDEEVRAEFLPILEARDRLGCAVAYPGVLMSYYASSLAGGRFKGCQAYLFLFDQPQLAMAPGEWLLLLTHVAARFRGGMQITQFSTDYARYSADERVHARLTVANQGESSGAIELQLLARGPHESSFRPLKHLRRCAPAADQTEAFFDVRLPDGSGLWTLRAELYQDPLHTHELSLEGSPQLIERREIGILQLAGAVQTPAVLTVDGPRIQLEGRDDFWVGTHYYPSSSWWEWLWRDFRPHLADRDLAAIRRAGYRLVRIWIDPVLDEVTLRAVDVAIWLAARHGLILDICLFNQWVRRIGFERPDGEHVALRYRDPADFNVFGISLRNMDLQRAYAATMARRWRGAGNVIYNLSNETYIKDPDASQMDAEVTAWPEAQLANGSARDSLLFRRWARELSQAMRAAGAAQHILPGYLFSTLKGGDNHLANRDAEIVPWHCYHTPEMCAQTLQFFDSASSDRPIILEEFGTLGWNPTAHYDGCAHYALAGGAAAAMSYEWGVSWLAREMCYEALPMREALVEEPDPRWFPPSVEIARSWPARGVGLCLTPSGFGYGSIYHGTPFPAEAAVALGRLGRMGQGLGRARYDEQVYVFIPTASADAMEPVLSCLQELWRLKVPFGVWQEDALASLPSSVQVLIAPLGVGTSEMQIESLRQRGVEVYLGMDSGWQSSTHLAPVAATPNSATQLLIRRTVRGTLYLLTSAEPISHVTVALHGGMVETGLRQFGLIHEGRNGILLIEAAGEVRLQGRPWCNIRHGRAFIASSTEDGLLTTRRIRLLATEPTTIDFERPIAAIGIEDENTRSSTVVVPGFSSSMPKLEIDDELIRHIVWIEFA
jgi:hypothetical protein